MYKSFCIHIHAYMNVILLNRQSESNAIVIQSTLLYLFLNKKDLFGIKICTEHTENTSIEYIK